MIKLCPLVCQDASPSRWEGEREEGPEPERKPATVNAREWVDQRKVRVLLVNKGK